MATDSDEMKCKSRNSKGVLGPPHVCGLEKGHKGKHRCTEISEGSIAKPRKRATPCNVQWEGRKRR